MRPIASSTAVTLGLSAAVVLGIAVLTPAALAPSAHAQAPNGAALYNAQCKSCHAVTGKSGPAGPSLKGVAGRKVASLGDYKYSKALTAKGGTWTDGALDAYLANPAGFAPGGKMFNKVADPKARTAIITYLKTQP